MTKLGRRRREQQQLAFASQQRTQIISQQVSFSGPLPHPNILARYNEVVPGAAERILTMAEEQAKHRQGLENRVVSGNVRAQELGVKLGSMLGALVVIGGTIITLTGHDIRGFAGALGAGALLVANSIYQRRRQEKERKEKTQAFGELPPAP